MKKLKLLAIMVATITIATSHSIGVSAAWKQNQRNWYYLNDSGEAKIGWINDNGTWYYLDNLGVMKIGWINDNGTWYYLDNSGAMKTGWINDNGIWYFSDVSGAMQTGVVQVDGKTYYLNNFTGAMQVGNVIINGKTYIFAQSGEAAGTDLVPAKVFNSNGVKITENNNSNNTPNTNEEITSTSSSSSSHNNKNNSSKVNKVLLINAIKEARLKYESAVEGTEVGQYEVGSKATFKTAIDEAQAVVDNAKSTQKDIDSALTALEAAKTIFNSSINKDVDSGKSTNYLEEYRQQYHYSVSKGWANDPNGMVYFNGEYHLFYQYYPDKAIWGPMHWGHAVSKDLIHWEELPIALYPEEPNPDNNEQEGYVVGMFSGSVVVDSKNNTGFFDGIEGGGLVAIYTQDYKRASDKENRQRQCIAYSKDNGRTWTQYEGNPVISAEDDPLNDWAFRDPKVFYHEETGKWMMVVAGGPLRIFSSNDLKNWEPEAMQPEIQTECPDLFKLEVGNTGTYKWVLSGGGRYYWIGDFKEIDGVFTFVPDGGPSNKHVMNFGKDSYAAQTYYGEDLNGTPDGRRIMINWMNNWDYCNNIAQITKTFNGNFNLQQEVKLIETNEGIRMTQQPIEEYKSLRRKNEKFENVKITPGGKNIMEGITGNQYEIVAEFKPDANVTEVGFKFRVGKDAKQETIVKYNVKTGKVVIDRSKSGKTPSNADKFLETYSENMEKTSDRTIKLHIFVDEASVEVFGNDGKVAGAAQIFPNRSSRGIEVYSLGGNTTATIDYYSLDNIWGNKIEGLDSVILSLSEKELRKNVGDEFTIYTSTIPETAAQGVSWNFSNPEVIEIVEQDDEKTIFRAKQIGSTTLTATSKDGKSSETANLDVYSNNPDGLITGLTNFENTGSWYVKDGTYTGESILDGFAIAEQTNSNEALKYTLEADVEFLDTSNTAGFVLASKNENPKEGSIIANVNKNGEYRVFEFTGNLDENGDAEVKSLIQGNVEVEDVYNIKVEVVGNRISYWINGELVCDTKLDSYRKGRFGLNVFGGETAFKNVSLRNNLANNSTTVSGSSLTFKNTSGDIRVSGNSYIADGGKKKNSVGISDQIIDTTQATYTLEVDSKILGDWHVDNSANGDTTGVVLFSQGEDPFKNGGIIANVGKWGHYRLFAIVKDIDNGGMKEVQLAEGDAKEADYNKYKLKLELKDNRISYWINDELVTNVKQDFYTNGKFGLYTWNGASEFKNIFIDNGEPSYNVESNLTFDESLLGNVLYVNDDMYILDGGKGKDGFAVAKEKVNTETEKFTLEADVKFLGGKDQNWMAGNSDVAGIVLLSEDGDPKNGSIIANINRYGELRLFRFDSDGKPIDYVGSEGDWEKVPEADEYHLRVEIEGKNIKYYIDGKLVGEVEQDVLTKGYFGLNTYNGIVGFANIKVNIDLIEENSLLNEILPQDEVVLPVDPPETEEVEPSVNGEAEETEEVEPSVNIEEEEIEEVQSPVN